MCEEKGGWWWWWWCHQARAGKACMEQKGWGWKSQSTIQECGFQAHLHLTLSSGNVSSLHAVFLLILLLLNLILTPLCQCQVSLETIGLGSFPEAQAENIPSMFSFPLDPPVCPEIYSSPE